MFTIAGVGIDSFMNRNGTSSRVLDHSFQIQLLVGMSES